jgi:hypothetical protein
MDPGHPFYDPHGQDRRVVPGEREYLLEVHPELAAYDAVPLTWASQPPEEEETR